jgi:hypothetical protein
MRKTSEEILAPKPEARPRIYAYSIADDAHKGLHKVGQTTRDVKQRVAEQLKTAAIKNYTIELDESAERDDGTIFTDHQAGKGSCHLFPSRCPTELPLKGVIQWLERCC